MTVNPIAAGLLATQLVGEPITLNLVLGLVAVFAGIWIATTEARPQDGRCEHRAAAIASVYRLNTYTPTASPTNTLTSTPTVTVTNTATPTNTSTVTLTSTPTATPTNTYTPTATYTLTGTSTNTPTGTRTPTSTFTVTRTNTPTTVPTNTSTNTATSTRTQTSVPTNTATSTNTQTPVPPTLTATVTLTPCTISFTDVHPSDYFYNDVRCLYCLGAISGYADGYFRPYNNTTRGQMTKIVVLALRIPITTPTGTATTFPDVPRGSTFFDYIETAAHFGIVTGYGDGPSRPNADVTRGQLSKIDVIAASYTFNWQILNPATATFSDVPRGSTFYTYIETAACHGIISGYADGTFRPDNFAIRAQIAKIVCNTSQNPPSICTP